MIYKLYGILKTLDNNIPSLLCYCHCYIQLSFRLGSHYTLGHYVRHTHLLAGHIPKERYYFCIQWKSMTDVYTKCSGQTWCEHSLPLTGLIVTPILPGLFSIYFTERQRHNCCVQHKHLYWLMPTSIRGLFSFFTQSQKWVQKEWEI